MIEPAPTNSAYPLKLNPMKVHVIRYVTVDMFQAAYYATRYNDWF